MSEASGTDYRRVQRKVAREYRKLGFKVLETPTGADLPPFLEGFSPDLIAVSDSDCVVVEIKRADTLKGSNELTELAARVAEHPKWRFELFTLAAPKDVESPIPSKVALDRLLNAISEAYESENLGQRWVSLTALISTLERLLNLVAVERGIEATSRPLGSLVRELSFQGIIGEAALLSFNRAHRWRDEILDGGSGGPTPALDEIEQVIAVCRELQSALIEFWDAGSVGRKEVNFSATAISELPDSKPAIYTIQSANGRVIYVGYAVAGRVRERIRRHLSERPRRMPGEKVTILQFDTDTLAREAEQTAIQEFSPKYIVPTQDLRSA
jgi:hypothetical protein